MARCKTTVAKHKGDIEEAVTGNTYSVATTTLSDAMFGVALRDRHKVMDVMAKILSSLSRVYATQVKKVTVRPTSRR